MVYNNHKSTTCTLYDVQCVLNITKKAWGLSSLCALTIPLIYIMCHLVCSCDNRWHYGFIILAIFLLLQSPTNHYLTSPTMMSSTTFQINNYFVHSFTIQSNLFRYNYLKSQHHGPNNPTLRPNEQNQNLYHSTQNNNVIHSKTTTTTTFFYRYYKYPSPFIIITNKRSTRSSSSLSYGKSNVDMKNDDSFQTGDNEWSMNNYNNNHEIKKERNKLMNNGNDNDNDNNNESGRKMKHNHNFQSNNLGGTSPQNQTTQSNRRQPPHQTKRKKGNKQIMSHYELKSKMLLELQIISYYHQSLSHSQMHSTIIRSENGTNQMNNNNTTATKMTDIYQTVETDILNTIWSCQSIPDLHDVVLNIVKAVKDLHSMKKHDDHHRIEKDINRAFKNNADILPTIDDFALLGPNIASAVLRRIVDLYQQQRKQRLSKYAFMDSSKDRRWTNSSNATRTTTTITTENDDMLEQMIVERYIPTLFQLIFQELIGSKSQDEEGSTFSTSMFQPFHQWSSKLDESYLQLSKSSTMQNIDDSNNSTTTSTEMSEKEFVFAQQMTHFSCVNMLHSIGTILRNHKQYNGISVRFLYENLNDIVDEISSLLLHPRKNGMDSVDVTIDNDAAHYLLLDLPPKRLLEILVSMATLVQFQNRYYALHESTDTSLNVIPITISSSSLPTILKSDIAPTESTSSIPTLIHIIGNRLHQGDAIGKFNGNDLSLGLWSLFILRAFHYDMVKSFMRRLRKKSMRESLSSNEICKSLWSIGQLMEMLNEVEGRQLELQRRQEKVIMDDVNGDGGHLNPNSQDSEEYESYDGLFETNIAASPHLAVESNEINGMILSHEETAIIFDQCETCCYTLLKELTRALGKKQSNLQTKLCNLKERQVADILYTCVLLDMDRDDDIVRALVVYLGQKNGFHSRYRVADIARILWSMQRLNIKNQTETISILIDHFLHLMIEKKNDAIVPKTLMTILRSIVLILPDNGRKEKDLLQALLPLLRNHAYLKRCNEFEVSNFVFVLAMTDLYDKTVIRALASRMIEVEIVESCTPSSASRFLWSLSKLVNDEQDYEMDELLFETFQALGGVLLSSQLTPVDASSSMWAIAKSSYTLDLGIFDHLAEMLAKDEMLERASVQQVCFGLWSCGKMINFEDPLREKMEHGEVTPPPYLSYAIKYATFLVSVVDQMTTKDLAQVSSTIQCYVHYIFLLFSVDLLIQIF